MPPGGLDCTCQVLWRLLAVVNQFSLSFVLLYLLESCELDFPDVQHSFFRRDDRLVRGVDPESLVVQFMEMMMMRQPPVFKVCADAEFLFFSVSWYGKWVLEA